MEPTQDPGTDAKGTNMTTRFRRRHFLLTAGMALLLGACSGASTPTATSAPNSAVAPSPTAVAAPSQQASTPVVPGSTGPGAGGIADPCSLLTQAEVDAAVGQPLGQGKTEIAHVACVWWSSDFGAGVHLTVGDWESVKDAASANGGTPTAIAGLGDEAWTASGNNGSLVYTRKGSNGFLLLIDGPQIDSLSDHGVAQEKVLAAAILGRL
jgi:Protein of unknown function (DUF3558)